MEALYKQLHEIIQENQSFILTSHIHSDGDAVGSVIALRRYILRAGKDCQVFLPGDPPQKYHFLNTREAINKRSRIQRQTMIEEAEVIVILDISALDRLDYLYNPIKSSDAYKVCIDHHPVEQEWVDLHIVDVNKASTAEMLYDYFKINKITIDRSMAQALYTGVMSDSGNFRFERTTGNTFRMAAELTDLGVNPSEIYARVYETGNHRQLKAWGKLLGHVEVNGSTAFLAINRKQMQNYNLALEDIDGLIDLMRKDGRSKIFAVFVEKAHKEVIVGLRSKNGVNVGRIAEEFGGGGHFHASGFTRREEALQDVVRKTLQRIRELGKLQGERQ